MYSTRHHVCNLVFIDTLNIEFSYSKTRKSGAGAHLALIYSPSILTISMRLIGFGNDNTTKMVRTKGGKKAVVKKKLAKKKPKQGP